MEENRPLAPFTTFGIGGPARWFVEAESEAEIMEATGWARERRMPIFVLGGGSNLLVADAGFAGLVLRIGLRGVASDEPIIADKGARRLYQVAAGEDWDSFVQRTVEDNCAGIECLAGIPGTVGGTPVQNVGAYGQEVASTIEAVRVFDLEEREFRAFTAAECGFDYRSSRFNSADRARFIVTRVDYRLAVGGAPTLRYVDLERAIQENGSTVGEPSLVEVAETVRRVRQAKGMLLVEGDADCRSAGSFFKNPIVSQEHFQRIAESTEEAPPSFPAGIGANDQGQVKIPAAWLVEKAGFAKGYRLGEAAISSRHTLALTNLGSAKAQEVLELATQIRAAVEANFIIRLEMEPVMVGF